MVDQDRNVDQEEKEKQISKAISLVLSLASGRKKDDVFNGELPIQMQISVKRIPKDQNQTHLVLKLPHIPSQTGDDICLFVKDLDKTKRDTEATVAFYQDLLSQKGVNNIKEIVPVKGLKTDFKPFEARMNLSNAYDIYLADERVVSCLPRLLGKSFYGRKRAPTQINIRATDLKGEIHKALRKSKFSFSVRGNSSMAVVGHSGMTEDDLTANVMAAIDQISSAVPGSSENIRQLSIKARSCTSIPIYMSTEGGPQNIKFKKTKSKKARVEVDELSSIPDAKVAVYPDGKVLVIRKGQTLKDAKAQNRKSNLKKRKQEVKDQGKGIKSKRLSKKSLPSGKSPKKLKKIK